MSTTLHKDLTGADLHVNKLHADTHVVAGTDPLVLAESQVTDLPADLADLASGLDGKASTVHAHTKSQITDFPALGTAAPKDVATSGDASATQVVKGDDTRLVNSRNALDVYAWAKAVTQPAPITHAHAEADVTNLTTNLAAKKTDSMSAADKILGSLSVNTGPIREIPCTAAGRALLDDASAAAQLVTLGAIATGDSRLSDARTPVAHAHPEDQITDLVSDLADKVETDDARLSDARAPTTHTHPESDVVSLVSDLAGKVGTGDSRLSDSRTPVAHTQAESTVIDLVDDLAGKASTVHSHVKADVTDFPASLPASDVSAWAKEATKPSYANTEVGAAAASHTHVLAAGATDVTATAAELNYTDGVTSAIQTQFGAITTVLDGLADALDLIVGGA